MTMRFNPKSGNTPAARSLVAPSALTCGSARATTAGAAAPEEEELDVLEEHEAELLAREALGDA
eukprot:15454596-Alexandrium_andersonii.AAC.1